jgi:hypothetical protein
MSDSSNSLRHRFPTQNQQQEFQHEEKKSLPKVSHFKPGNPRTSNHSHWFYGGRWYFNRDSTLDSSVQNFTVKPRRLVFIFLNEGRSAFW